MICEETCLNDHGVLTGFYLDTTSRFHGFLREASGAITIIDAPGAGTGQYTGTVSASVDSEGETAGYAVDDSGVARAWVRHRDGTFTVVKDPAAATDPGQGTVVYSINRRGTVTGIYIDAENSLHGFAHFQHGGFRHIDAPDAGAGAGQGTRPSTNNARGEVAGWYIDAQTLNHSISLDARRQGLRIEERECPNRSRNSQACHANGPENSWARNFKKIDSDKETIIMKFDLRHGAFDSTQALLCTLFILLPLTGCSAGGRDPSSADLFQQFRPISREP